METTEEITRSPTTSPHHGASLQRTPFQIYHIHHSQSRLHTPSDNVGEDLTVANAMRY